MWRHKDIQSISLDADRGFTVNGAEFVPIYAWFVHREYLELLAECGVNTALSPQADAAYAEAAARCGIYIGAEPKAAELAGHPRLLCWLHEDEPDTRIPGGPRLVMNRPEGAVPEGTAAVEQLIGAARARLDAVRTSISERGDGRPAFLNFSYLFLERFWAPESVSGQLYSAMAEFGDWLSWDIYPLADFGRRDFLPFIWQGTRRLRGMAPAKPLSVFLETMAFGGEFGSRERSFDPSYEEMRNEAWQAVVAGASAIGWFTYGACRKGRERKSFALDEEQREILRRVNKELILHASFLRARELCSGARLDAQGLPEAAVSLRADDVAIYWIAVNPRYDRQRIGWGEDLEICKRAPEAEVAAAAARLPPRALAPLEPLEVRLFAGPAASKFCS